MRRRYDSVNIMNYIGIKMSGKQYAQKTKQITIKLTCQIKNDLSYKLKFTC